MTWKNVFPLTKDVMSRLIKTNEIAQLVVFRAVIYAGERWDIVLRANQAVGSYWIKFRGLMDCDDRFTSAFQVAVLNYNTVPEGTLPRHVIKSWHEAKASDDGIVCLFLMIYNFLER
jgi:hypothetical protein